MWLLPVCVSFSDSHFSEMALPRTCLLPRTQTQTAHHSFARLTSAVANRSRARHRKLCCRSPRVPGSPGRELAPNFQETFKILPTTGGLGRAMEEKHTFLFFLNDAPANIKFSSFPGLLSPVLLPVMLPCHVHKHAGARAHVFLPSCCVDRLEYYVDAQTQRAARDGQSLLLARAKNRGRTNTIPGTRTLERALHVLYRPSAAPRTNAHTQTQTLLDGTTDNNLSLYPALMISLREHTSFPLSAQQIDGYTPGMGLRLPASPQRLCSFSYIIGIDRDSEGLC